MSQTSSHACSYCCDLGHITSLPSAQDEEVGRDPLASTQLPGLGTWRLGILRETSWSWMCAAGQHWRCGDRHSRPFFFSKVTEKQLYEAHLARDYLFRNKLTGRERLLIFHFPRDQGQEWAYWKEFCSFLRNTKPHLFCKSCDEDWGTAHPAKRTGVAAVHWLCVGLST